MGLENPHSGSLMWLLKGLVPCCLMARGFCSLPHGPHQGLVTAWQLTACFPPCAGAGWETKVKVTVFLHPNLWSNISSVLPYTLGHTDHLGTMWEGTTQGCEYRKWETLGTTLEAACPSAHEIYFRWRTNMTLLINLIWGKQGWLPGFWSE